MSKQPAEMIPLSPRPTLIAQISDLHIKPPGQLAYGRVDTAAALKRAVHALNTFSPRPDLVVITGDLADTPLKEEYEHLKLLLAPLQIPYAAIPGNHDRRPLMRAALPDLGYVQADGAMNASRAVGDLDILLVDSTVPGAHHGELDAATIAWLDDRLATSTTRPALMFMHHPPFVSGIGYMDRIMLRNTGALADLIARHPRTRLVAAGHVHRAAQTSFAGISATICPAGEQACALDLEARWGEVFMEEPPAFHLHTWFPGDGFGTLVTHLAPIGEMDGPYLFEGGKKVG